MEINHTQQEERPMDSILWLETLKADGPDTAAFRNDLRRTREQPKLFHRFIYFDEEEEERRWIERDLPR